MTKTKVTMAEIAKLTAEERNSAASLSERFDVSRQHTYKVRAGKQVPWRRAVGPVPPDDAPLADEREVGER